MEQTVSGEDCTNKLETSKKSPKASNVIITIIYFPCLFYLIIVIISKDWFYETIRLELCKFSAFFFFFESTRQFFFSLHVSCFLSLCFFIFFFSTKTVFWQNIGCFYIFDWPQVWLIFHFLSDFVLVFKAYYLCSLLSLLLYSIFNTVFCAFKHVSARFSLCTWLLS